MLSKTESLYENNRSMKVLTADSREFARLCLKLKEMVKSSGYEYDILIGIARGGVYVADYFESDMTFSIKTQRAGTSVKTHGLSRILRRLPSFVNMALRCAEAKALEIRDRFFKPAPVQVSVGDRLRDMLRQGGHKVLVVDDAADSGRSLLSVLNAISECGSNEIRSAVITVTRKHPAAIPDYALFRNSTLVRFPWSADMKNGL